MTVKGPYGLVSLQLLTSGGEDRERIDSLTRALRKELDEAQLASAAVPPGPAVPGAKGVDPYTLGALALTVLPAVAPKLVEFLQAWSTRTRATVRLKLQSADRSVEVELSPGATSTQKLQEYIQTLRSALEHQPT
jgi:hypothetical protein